MTIITKIGIVMLTALIMEFVAWFTHKYVMHGLLWSWHEDHHDPDMKHGFFEKNDRFFFSFCHTIIFLLHVWIIIRRIFFPSVYWNRYFPLWVNLFPHS